MKLLPLLAIAILLPSVLFSQQVDTIQLDDIEIIETGGLYQFLDSKQQPLNGIFFITSKDEGSLESGFIGGLAQGQYTQYDGYSGLKVYTFNFDKGVRHGEQITYHSTGKVRERYSLCYGTSHGKATHHEPDNGEVIETKYFVIGLEMESEKKFNDTYFKMPCVQKAAEEAAANIKIATVDAVKLDTTKVENETVFAEGIFPKSYFSSKTNRVDSIKIVIVASDSYNILSYCYQYKPSPNEIAIFYGVVSITNTRQMHFALGDQTRAALLENSLEPTEVVGFFEHRVFNVGSFPGIMAYEYLKHAINKTDPALKY